MVKELWFFELGFRSVSLRLGLEKQSSLEPLGMNFLFKFFPNAFDEDLLFSSGLSNTLSLMGLGR